MGILSILGSSRKSPGESTDKVDPSKRIFRKDVEEKSASEFGEAVVKGQKMKGRKLKEHVAELAEGGISAKGMEKKLKKMGVEGGQIGKRKRIMKVVGEGDKETKTKPQIRRAVYQPVDPRTGRLQRDGIGTETPETQINPLTAGTVRRPLGKAGAGDEPTPPLGSPPSSPPPSPPTPPPRIPLAG